MPAHPAASACMASPLHGDVCESQQANAALHETWVVDVARRAQLVGADIQSCASTLSRICLPTRLMVSSDSEVAAIKDTIATYSPLL